MTVNHTPENWEVLGRMYGAIANLANELEAKGYKVICSLSVGIHPACVTFIVERNCSQILSFCSLDVLSEEDKLKRDLFTKGEELLATDLDAVEREYLLKRLEELNHPSNAKR